MGEVDNYGKGFINREVAHELENRRLEQCNLSSLAFLDDDDGTDVTSGLPLLQPVWTIFLRYGDYTRSPLFPIAIGVGTFFLCLIPYSFLDYFGRDWQWVRRSKIQRDVMVSWSVTRNAIVLTVWNQLLYVLPVSIAQCVWTPPTHLPCRAPGIWEFVWHHYVALVLVDVQFYLWHVLHHHSRFLYRHVHSIHHTYATINCWSVQYLHPWELICVGVFGTVAPWMLHSHPLTVWSFMVFLNFLSVDEHSGYSFPLAPHRWIPFYGGAAKHDMHHLRPMTNLQPYFIWFDYIAGNHSPAQLTDKEESKKTGNLFSEQTTAAVMAHNKFSATKSSFSNLLHAAARLFKAKSASS